MKYCFTLSCACFLLFRTGVAQETSLPKIDFHLNMEAFGEHQMYRYFSPVRVPESIRSIRKNSGKLPISYDSVTDNPLRHGVMYAAVKTRTTIGGIVELNADLYGEYRGFSYGTFNDNNIVLFPVLSASVRDSLRIGKHYVHVKGEVGQFLDERMDEGLTIYNIDLQGTKVEGRYKNSLLAVKIYGDLTNAIGLGIDDLKAFSYTHFFNKDSAALGVSYVMAAPSYAPAKYHTYYNLFGHFHTTNGFSYYGQFSFTRGFAHYFDQFKGLNRQVAGLIGMAVQLSRGRFSLHNNTEVRYYGYVYNLFHYESGLRYRNPAATPDDMYNNTIGKYLYPLRKFNTPFSQWAVFTEYIGYNTLAAAITGDMNYKISEKIAFHLDYDINAIHPMLDKTFYDDGLHAGFIYPFFKMAARYCPVKGVYVALFLSNKTMNLDVNYPTQYLLKKPFGGIEFYISR